MQSEQIKPWVGTYPLMPGSSVFVSPGRRVTFIIDRDEVFTLKWGEFREFLESLKIEAWRLEPIKGCIKPFKNPLENREMVISRTDEDNVQIKLDTISERQTINLTGREYGEVLTFLGATDPTPPGVSRVLFDIARGTSFSIITGVEDGSTIELTKSYNSVSSKIILGYGAMQNFRNRLELIYLNLSRKF